MIQGFAIERVGGSGIDGGIGYGSLLCCCLRCRSCGVVGYGRCGIVGCRNYCILGSIVAGSCSGSCLVGIGEVCLCFGLVKGFYVSCC